jgi:hypothetical protein
MSGADAQARAALSGAGGGMSFDTKCYDLAKVWLAHAGWNNTLDIDRLAQRIQDCIEDFEAELEKDLDV